MMHDSRMEVLDESTVRYVPHSDVQAYLGRGWVIVSRQCDMRHHGARAVIMEYVNGRNERTPRPRG